MISRYIQSRLDIHELFFDQGIHLRNLVEECFLLPNEDCTLFEKAGIILNTLFLELVPKSLFSDFLEHIPSRKEQRDFLTRLLYHILGCNFPVWHLKSWDIFHAYLFQTMASVCSKKTICTLFNHLTATEQLKIIAFCYKHYEEGSYNTVYALKGYQELIDLLETGLISTDAFFQWAFSEESDLPHFLNEQKSLIKEACKQLISNSSISEKTALDFITIFGLYGYETPLHVTETSSFKEHIQSRIHAHLQALPHPERYQKGLEKITYSIPTCGRDLEKMPALHSILDGITSLSNHFHLDAGKFAVYVYDQSDKKCYDKNNRYIKRLQKQYKTHIHHLDRDSIIEMAKKRGVEKLVVTGPHGRFGYSGARNTALLLAPKDQYVVIVDDDIQIPASNFYSDALFVYEHAGSYFSRSGLIIGRATTETFTSIDPDVCLSRTSNILSQSFWSDTPTKHNMSTLLSSPKVCLNIPLGQEENHFTCIKTYDFDLRKPARHLAGVRYPKKSLPTNRYSGLAEHLEWLNYNAFGLLMVSELLDPPNIFNCSALIWNQKKEPFTSFAEAITYICHPATVHAMQKQFWKNFEAYVQGFNDMTPYQEHLVLPSSRMLKKLIHLDTKKLLANHPSHFKSDLKKLMRFFKKMSQEASWTQGFAFTLDHLRKQMPPLQALEVAQKEIEAKSGKSIEDHYFTYSLYIVCKSIGAHDFQTALEALRS